MSFFIDDNSLNQKIKQLFNGTFISTFVKSYVNLISFHCNNSTNSLKFQWNNSTNSLKFQWNYHTQAFAFLSAHFLTFYYTFYCIKLYLLVVVKFSKWFKAINYLIIDWMNFLLKSILLLKIKMHFCHHLILNSMLWYNLIW